MDQAANGDSNGISNSDTGIIELEEKFRVNLESLRELFKNEINLNKYTPYTRQLEGVDEDCMRVAYSFFQLVDKKYHLLINDVNDESVIDTYNIGVQLKTVLEDPNNRVSSRLRKLVESFPTKGRDGPVLVKWYKDNYQLSTKEAQIHIIRNFSSGTYCWQFPTVTDHTLLDSCGSLISLAMVMEYCGAVDDPQYGDIENFLAATNDGIRSLNGHHMAKFYSDLKNYSAFVRMKDFVTSDNGHLKNASKVVTYQNLTPERFFELRYWDGGLQHYYQLLASYASLDMEIKCDVNGVPFCFEKCNRTKRAADSSIWYNEIVDILSDVKVKERFNELLVSFANGGRGAINGYADAVASITEDVLDCNCGSDGHQWAGSIAIGMCNLTSLYPRYQMLCQVQLAARDKTPIDSYINTQWRPFSPYADRKCILENNMLLHKNVWEPVWHFGDTTNDVVLSTYDDPRHPCSMCMQSAIAISGRILVQKRSMAAKSLLPEIIYNLIGCSGKRGESGDYQCVPDEARVHATIWTQICSNLYNFGCTEKASEKETLAAESAIRNVVENFCLATWKPWSFDVSVSLIVELYNALDIVMRTTYDATVAVDGIWRRKLLMGLVASFLEFSAVNAYATVFEYAFAEEIAKVD